MLTGFPFHPESAFAPQGHLTRIGLYAAVLRPASRQAPDWPPASALRGNGRTAALGARPQAT